MPCAPFERGPPLRWAEAHAEPPPKCKGTPTQPRHGAWSLQRPRPHATADVAMCVALCAACDNCRFVSTSRGHDQCAWFEAAACDPPGGLWVGPTGGSAAGDTYLYQTYEVWGRTLV